MTAASGYCNRIKHLEEIKAKTVEQTFCSSVFRWKFRPAVICCLSLTEYILNAVLCIKQIVNILRLAFVCQGYLVLEVIETVVHRSGRKHKDFCLYTLTDYLVKQLQISVLFRIFIIFVCSNLTAVTEIMTFVYHHKVIIAPVDMGKVKTVRLSACARQVGMKQYIVSQAVGSNRIVQIIAAICYPIVVKLFRA